MKDYHLLVLRMIFITLIFSSCSSPENQSLSTTIATNSTEFNSSSSTPVASFTPSATLPAQTPTLIPAQYPSLSEIVLTSEDLSKSPLVKPFLFNNSSYENVLPSVYDLTQELISDGDCYLDCVKKLWVNGELEITLTLIRRSNPEEAQQASQDRCFELFPSDVYKPTKYDDCLFAMIELLKTPNTWAFVRFLGGTYNTINIFAEMSFIDGHDMNIYQWILTDIAKLQVDKFVQAGIPSNP